MPGTSAGAANVEVTQLQQSIFNAPAPGTGGQPTKPAADATAGGDTAMNDANSPEGRGQKRPRDEEVDEEEEDSDVAMEEDSDDD